MPPNVQPAVTTVGRTRLTVFGLDVYSDTPPSYLHGARAGATGRELRFSLMAGGATELGWPDCGELICDEREPDGAVNFRIEHHPNAGYLIWGPTYGAHLLSLDGRHAGCTPGDPAAEAWQRLLIAQVLPFAALLGGLEVFHCSAVTFDGQAIAFLGPSGAGKTSLALELCGLGASFLTDDVLVLERAQGELVGHPGTPIAGVAHAETARWRASQGRRATEEHTLDVNARERILRMRGAGGPAPLAALFFLDRRPDGPWSPRFEPVADARLLLGATFNFVLATPERLRGLLEVSALAAQRRVERIVVGPSVDAARLALAVAQRLDVA